MEIKNKRAASTQDSTIGVMYIDNIPYCFVIEDEKRDVKVKGETRIPTGRYKLVIQNNLTGMTVKYREKYPWFKNHIQLQNVPNFEDIYIHVGNTEEDTAGCQVIGKTAHIAGGEFVNSESTTCFMEFYHEIYPRLEKGETIYYTITDEN